MTRNFFKIVAFFNRSCESLTSLRKPRFLFCLFKHTRMELTIVIFLRLGNTMLEIQLCRSVLFSSKSQK
uniref:Uncharacterized protein n=1 Tax=Solanum tuberosum TaxID=4113 RepID=M1B6N6_SOLTU